MAKSKNHTAHNQNFKDHRNGIKKPKSFRKTPRKGMDTKFVVNQKFCLKGVQRKLAEKAAAGKA